MDAKEAFLKARAAVDQFGKALRHSGLRQLQEERREMERAVADYERARAEPAELTPEQAVGVALSIPLATTEMNWCQSLAPAVVAHLAAMGFEVRPSGKSGRRTELIEKIRHAINCMSAENGSNTPDFILAEFSPPPDSSRSRLQDSMDTRRAPSSVTPTAEDIAVVRGLRSRYSVRRMAAVTGVSAWVADRVLRSLPVRRSSLLALRLVAGMLGRPEPSPPASTETQL